MSVSSMTGYGVGAARAPGARIEVELSSVNRKTLDIRSSLPPELRLFDPDLQRAIAERLSRGAVNCNARIDWTQKARSAAVSVDRELARAYIDAIKTTASQLGIENEIGPEILLDLPGVVRADQPEIEEEKFRAALLRATGTALKGLDRMRWEEGRKLAEDVSARIDNLECMAHRIAERRPAALEQHRRRLHATIEEANAEVDSERLMREVLIYADKSDIAEELARIESHFSQMRRIMRGRDPAGRPLEFICQELLREINTVASKSPDAIIAATAIEFKSELERVREQVRNIE